MHKISRQKTIEGTTVPGFISNGEYMYINVHIFEDGMVNCWELVDMQGLSQKIELGWLTASVPERESIMVFDLGSFRVLQGKWNYDQEGYYERIVNVLHDLNPSMTNIYKMTLEEKMKMEQRRIIPLAEPQDFYIPSEDEYTPVHGDGSFIFMRREQKNYLVYLTVYQDGRIKCESTVFEETFHIHELHDLFMEGVFFTEIHTPLRVVFDHLGEADIISHGYSVNIEQKYDQLQAIYRRLNEKKTDSRN
ncbi:DUF7638 domain-containing protein [Paenibacillus dauci]|uniref:DUF7638 domain-containing protein n=1 Tax=Paenibacillus dauci TaxID=1567106 RepID=UPI0006979A9E|nr:hypothetical protein [Paenibacillus dauci]